MIQNLLPWLIFFLVAGIIGLGIAALIDLGGFRQRRDVRKAVSERVGSGDDTRLAQLATIEAGKGKRHLDTIVRTIPNRLGEITDETPPATPPRRKEHEG